MKDIADAQNIAPIVLHFLEQGHACAVACDAGSKARTYITKHYPQLLEITATFSTHEALFEVHPQVSVYLSSMQSEGLGREPLSYYKEQGAWTAVFQETPGWRLQNWELEQLPDAMFVMSGAKEIVDERWVDYSGEIFETGMPSLDSLLQQAERIDTQLLRAQLNITPFSMVVHYAAPAGYTKEITDIVQNALNEHPDVALLARLHPKASDAEQTFFADFKANNQQVLPNDEHLSPTEAILVSDVTIAVIASTMTLQAVLLKRTAIGITSPSALNELTELGEFVSPEEFPYVKDGLVHAAGDAVTLSELLTKEKAGALVPTSYQTKQHAAQAIITEVSKHL